jgi:hypothetical protein
MKGKELSGNIGVVRNPIKMNLKDFVCEDVDWTNWTQLTQDRVQWPALLNMEINVFVPQNARTLLTSRATSISSKSNLLGVASRMD